jgi:hypothetical protein
MLLELEVFHLSSDIVQILLNDLMFLLVELLVQLHILFALHAVPNVKICFNRLMYLIYRYSFFIASVS